MVSLRFHFARGPILVSSKQAGTRGSLLYDLLLLSWEKSLRIPNSGLVYPRLPPFPSQHQQGIRGPNQQWALRIDHVRCSSHCQAKSGQFTASSEKVQRHAWREVGRHQHEPLVHLPHSDKNASAFARAAALPLRLPELRPGSPSSAVGGVLIGSAYSLIGFGTITIIGRPALFFCCS